MLRFYYSHSDQFVEAVKRKLENMVAAHKMIKVNADTKLPVDLQKKELPVLSDGHDLYSSQVEVRNYLEELHQLMITGREMQSDSCHIDPENPDECL